MEICKNATQKKICPNSEKIIQEITAKKLEIEIEAITKNSILTFQEFGILMSKLNFFKFIFNEKYKIYPNERGQIQNSNGICEEKENLEVTKVEVY